MSLTLTWISTVGLRCQSGHGSRTDVLDAPGCRAKVLGDERSPGRKSSRPLNVELNDCDRVATIAAHGDRESRPHQGHGRACESLAFLQRQLVWLQSAGLGNQPVEVDDGCVPTLDLPKTPPRHQRLVIRAHTGVGQAFGKGAGGLPCHTRSISEQLRSYKRARFLPDLVHWFT